MVFLKCIVFGCEKLKKSAPVWAEKNVCYQTVINLELFNWIKKLLEKSCQLVKVLKNKKNLRESWQVTIQLQEIIPNFDCNKLVEIAA